MIDLDLAFGHRLRSVLVTGACVLSGCNGSQEGSSATDSEAGSGEASSGGSDTSSSGAEGSDSAEGEGSGSSGSEASSSGSGSSEGSSDDTGSAGSSESGTGSSGETGTGSESGADTDTDTEGQPVCMPEGTEVPAPADFSMTRVPFFRGEVCIPDVVDAGADVPVTIRACIHPCITVGSGHGRDFNTCMEASCEGFLLEWFDDGIGTDCPADAFGNFDEGDCTWAIFNANLAAPMVDDQPRLGTFTAVVPFLTNDDIDVIADADMVSTIRETVRMAIESCRPGPDRRIDIEIEDVDMAPPDDCEDEPACTCHSIGL